MLSGLYSLIQYYFRLNSIIRPATFLIPKVCKTMAIPGRWRHMFLMQPMSTDVAQTQTDMLQVGTAECVQVFTEG